MQACKGAEFATLKNTRSFRLQILLNACVIQSDYAEPYVLETRDSSGSTNFSNPVYDLKSGETSTSKDADYVTKPSSSVIGKMSIKQSSKRLSSKLLYTILIFMCLVTQHSAFPDKVMLESFDLAS